MPLACQIDAAGLALRALRQALDELCRAEDDFPAGEDDSTAVIFDDLFFCQESDVLGPFILATLDVNVGFDKRQDHLGGWLGRDMNVVDENECREKD